MMPDVPAAPPERVARVPMETHWQTRTEAREAKTCPCKGECQGRLQVEDELWRTQANAITHDRLGLEQNGCGSTKATGMFRAHHKITRPFPAGFSNFLVVGGPRFELGTSTV